MSFLSSLTGGGGISGGPTDSTSGNASVKGATGNKTFNIGGNPNVSQALQSPWLIAGLALVAVVWFLKRRK